MLTHENGTEDVEISADGSFELTTLLADRDWYSLVLVGEPPCVIENDAGTIPGADVEVVVACAGAPLLTDIVFSGLAAPDLDVSLARFEYTAELSLLQQNATITPVALNADVDITVAGQPVASGTPSAPLPPSLGGNQVEIVVSHPSGLERSYRVTMRYAATLPLYAYGKASNTGEGDLFGRSLALSGDTLVVGAYRESSAATGVGGNQDDDSAFESGAVYVFRRDGDTWSQEAYIKASNTGEGDRFGSSVALSGDTLVVGASDESSGATGVNGDQSDDSVLSSGAVYVFRRTGGTWAQEAYLKAPSPDTFDYFGVSLALSGDLLAVGMANDDSRAVGINGDPDDDTVRDTGAVFIFRRDGDSWSQEAYIKASNPDQDDRFGHSVALSGDTLIVGARDEDSGAAGVNGDQSDDSVSRSGAVYVFRRTDATWAQEAYLKASNPGELDFFGADVALSGDTLAVGAWGESSAATGVGGDQSDDSTPGGGAVYVFRRTGATWTQEAYLKASDTVAHGYFGRNVALSGDTLAAGTGDEGGSGSDYLFRREGGTWAQGVYLGPQEIAGRGDLALSQDTLVVGSSLESTIYIFH